MAHKVSDIVETNVNTVERFTYTFFRLADGTLDMFAGDLTKEEITKRLNNESGQSV